MRTASGIRAYNVAFVLLAVLLAPPAALLCLVTPAWRRGLAARLGIGWPARTGRPVLWAHAASVGEVEAIAPVVQRWQLRNEGGVVVLSALTATGCAHARRLLPDAHVRTFPIDAPGLAGHVVRRVDPDLFLFTENEIWPNTLTALARAGVPAIQVSGRLSPRAARTLARFPRFARTVLGRVRRFCVQADEHRARLVELGVAPERVLVTGSLKGDARTAEPPAFLAALAAQGRPILIAGSTHPGEDEVVLAAAVELRRDLPPPIWILAPRHPQRFDAVAALLAARGLRFVRRSELPQEPDDPAVLRERLAGIDVLLLDTVGELAGCYQGASVAFVGATLVPIGGHNLLEAARCGVPVIVGPHLDTVRRVAERLVEAGGATVVADAATLAGALRAHLEPERRERAGAAARRVAAEESGSLDATWQAIEEVVRERTGAAR